MKIAFIDPSRPLPCDVGVGFCAEKCQLDEALAALDTLLDGFISKALAGMDFTGRRDEAVFLTLPPAAGLARLMVLGTGEGGEEADDAGLVRRGGILAARHADFFKASEAVLLSSGMDAKSLAALLEGMLLRNWKFTKYRTVKKPHAREGIKTLYAHVADVKAAEKAFAPRRARAEAVGFARDLVSEPGNVLYPASMAAIVAKHFAGSAVSVEVLSEKDIRALGMGALLGVAQGSEKAPRVVVLEYKGARSPKKAPIAFVGKGVTFDSGGISIKPADGMWDMKRDMAGAAAVVGLFETLAARKAKVNVVGILGLVENMPSGSAQRPGDVVVSMSGKTIEVQNTDAEGRLVLADCMWYAQECFAAKTVIDLATLTGAMVIALGKEHAGLFSNSTELAVALRDAGKKTGEKLWRLPMGEAYDKFMDSDIADMKNISGVRDAGSITAAQFLQRFIRDDVAWAHLDIAAVAWSDKDKALFPKGSTGFGIRLLDAFVADSLEKA